MIIASVQINITVEVLDIHQSIHARIDTGDMTMTGLSPSVIAGTEANVTLDLGEMVLAGYELATNVESESTPVAVTLGTGSIVLQGLNMTTSTKAMMALGVGAMSIQGLALSASTGTTAEADYYVATSGSDSNNGTSPATAWRTFAKTQSTNLPAGSIVQFGNGTFTTGTNLIRGGSVASPITYRAENKHGTIIVTTSQQSGIRVEADNVIIDGFEISGTSQHVDGVDIVDSHHVTVQNCKIHGFRESGIQFDYCEFCYAFNNIIYDCAYAGWFSGVSVYECRNITGDTTTPGFRTIVSGNWIYDNICSPSIPADTNNHGDSNGIIIDDFHHTQQAGSNYTYPTLVENNVIFNNGGKGIQIFESDAVTIRNNTCYKNAQDNLNLGTWRGEISLAMANNCRVVNNIAWCDKARYSGNDSYLNNRVSGTNTGNVWLGNISFTGTAGQTALDYNAGTIPTANNLFGVNPLLVNPTSSTATADFHLQAGSPAINASNDTYGLPTVDFDGNSRPQGAGTDIGAYERLN